MKKKWVEVRKGADFNQIAADFSISPYLARIIRNRGAVTNEEIAMYLNGDLSMMHDPALLRDMEVAVSILEDAIEAQIPIRVVGDYDIDGITASYILKKGIESAGGIVDVRLPERVKDGYGINEKMIRDAYDEGIELIITCDNGIAASKEVELALSLGMSVIVTDHHEVPYEMVDGMKKYDIPCADAVIDPKRPDCSYPFEGICGAMVCYKLISHLYNSASIGETVANRSKLLTEFLSFAAFATVGDMMELKDENRVAVKYGLAQLKNTDNVGMRALIEEKGLLGKDITGYHVGFVLGPCINATGRLETADAALDLFFIEDPDAAREKAKELSAINDSRKNLTDAFTKKAIKEVCEKYPDDRVVVVYMPECHESIAGLVAGKIKEEFYRPAIVLTNGSDGNLKGSGRSIEGYNMYDELSRIKDMFIRFGGHKMAAGLSLPAGSVDELRNKLNENCTLNDDDLVKKYMIDIPLPVGRVSEAFAKELSKLEPFGISNPGPLFAQKDVPIRSIKLYGSNCVKLVLEGTDEAGRTVSADAVCFEEAEKMYEELKDRKSVSILYQVGINEYNGKKSVQLTIKDWF